MQISLDQTSNICHEAVDTPEHSHLFPDAEIYATFCESLHHVTMAHILPPNFGIQPEEWDDRHYPLSETIGKGRRGRHEHVIPLPVDVWKPRAELWCQALSVMLSLRDLMS
jgi:hypothetical protein